MDGFIMLAVKVTGISMKMYVLNELCFTPN